MSEVLQSTDYIVDLDGRLTAREAANRASNCAHSQAIVGVGCCVSQALNNEVAGSKTSTGEQ